MDGGGRRVIIRSKVRLEPRVDGVVDPFEPVSFRLDSLPKFDPSRFQTLLYGRLAGLLYREKKKNHAATQTQIAAPRAAPHRRRRHRRNQAASARRSERNKRLPPPVITWRKQNGRAPFKRNVICGSYIGGRTVIWCQCPHVVGAQDYIFTIGHLFYCNAFSSIFIKKLRNCWTCSSACNYWHSAICAS